MLTFALGFITGAAALAAYQLYRRMKAGDTAKEAVKFVVQGGGPRPGTPK